MPYPKYKDSGVEWLGEVPEGWGVSSIKRFATFVYGDALPVDARNADGNVPVFGSNGSFGSHDQPNTRAPAILIGRKGSCGALNWSDIPVFAIDTVYFVDNRTCSANLHWFFWNLHIANLETASQDTGVPGLSREFAHSTMLPVPPEQEQQAIAAFLDVKTARIDELITDYESLITLLREKRQALISQAVTKGLHPDAPMKDSGVEWLREVPEHWGVVTLRRVAKSVETGATPTNNIASEEVCDGIPWYTPGDFIGQLNLRGSAKMISQEIKNKCDVKIFPNGSVMIVGIGATLGKVGYISEASAANQQINVVQSEITKANGYFLAFSLSVKKDNMYYLSNASTIGIINQEKTKEIWLALPPLPEQDAIAAFLDTETAHIDSLIADADEAVQLLQERRTALISDAVTGKIDVRDWQELV